MSFLSGLGTVVGGIVGGPAGAAIGSGAGTALGSLIGGGDSSSGAQPGDVYQQFAAQMAAQNNPLTASYQGLSLLQGALAGAIGQAGTTKASSQLSILAEALQRAQKDATLQASVAGYAAGKGLDTLYNLGQAKLATELQAPQLLAQAGSAALAGENSLANQLGMTNVGVRAYQEQLRGDVAKNQAETLNQVYQQRAQNEGLLALGAQQFENAAQLDKVRTLGDLARTKAATKGQLALKQFGANQAIAGTRMFA
jgi:hypothetical protein